MVLCFSSCNNCFALVLPFCFKHLVRIWDVYTHNRASLCLLILLTSNQ